MWPLLLQVHWQLQNVLLQLAYLPVSFWCQLQVQSLSVLGFVGLHWFVVTAEPLMLIEIGQQHGALAR